MKYKLLTFLIIGLLIGVGTASADIFSENLVGSNGNLAWNFNSGYDAIAATFTVNTTGTLTEISPYLGKVGSPVFTYSVALYEADGSGLPTGSELSNITGLSTGDISSGDNFINYTLNVDVTAGTQYIFIFDKTSSGGYSTSDYIRWWFNDTGTNYTQHRDSSGSWIVQDSTSTPRLIVYGTPANNTFSLSAIDSYTTSSLTNFSALINGTNYSTTNGTIITNISDDSPNLYNITVSSSESGGYFNRTYEDVNVSSDLEASLHQAEITFYATNRITGASVTNFTVTAPNGQTATGTNPTLNVTTGSLTYNFTKTGYYPSQVTANLSALEQGNATFTVYDHKLEVFLQDTNGESIENFTITVNSTDLGVFETATATTETTTETDNTEYTSTSTSYELVKTFTLGEETVLDSNLQEINYSIKSSSGSFTTSVRVTVNYEDGTSDSRTDSTTSTSYVDLNYDSSTFTFSNNMDVNNITFELKTTGSGTASLTDTRYEGERSFAQFNLTDGNYTVTINDSFHSLQSQEIELSPSVNLTDIVLTAFTKNTFNLSFYNETTNELLNNTNLSIEFISDSTAFNASTTNGTYYVELLTPDDYRIKYSLTGGEVIRNYYVTLNNRSFEDIQLYLIDEDISAYYIPVAVDEGTNPCQETTISLLRYYVEVNSYNVVEMAKTNSQGQAVLRVKPNNVDYKLLFQGDCGNFTSAPSRLIDTTNTYTITGGQEVLESLVAITDASTSLTYVNSTQTFVYTWTSSSNIITQGCLEVTQRKNGIRTLVANNCGSGNTGSVLYTITDTNETTYYANGRLYTSSSFSDETTSSLVIDFLTGFFDYDNYAPFAALLVFLSMILFLGINAASLVISVVAGLAILSLFQLVNISLGVILSFVVIGGAILYRLSTQ